MNKTVASAFATQRTEKRESYTDTFTNLLLDNAQHGFITHGSTSTKELIKNSYGRCLSSAKVSTLNPLPFAKLITPDVLFRIGAQCSVDGDSVWFIQVDKAGVEFLPVSHFLQRGSKRITYDLTIYMPDGNRIIRNVDSDSILHFRINPEFLRHWKGLGLTGNITNKVLQRIEQIFSLESHGALDGYLIEQQTSDKSVPIVESLKSSLSNLNGKSMLVEPSSNIATSPYSAISASWKQLRIGFTPPEELLKLRKDLIASVLNNAGIPENLFTGNSSSRESYRQFLGSAIKPFALSVAKEFSSKLDTEISLTFPVLQENDLTNKGRALKQLVDAGMNLKDALKIVQIQ